jgi:hypothetical protein
LEAIYKGNPKDQKIELTTPHSLCIDLRLQPSKVFDVEE